MSTRPGPATAYDRTSVAFHWISAVAIIAMWPIGKIMTGAAGEPSSLLYSTHVGLGLVVSVITVVRIIWIFRSDRPEELEMPRWERILFVANHYILYGLLLLLSLSGVAMLLAAGSFDAVALSKNDGPSDQHEITSTIFLLMFVMHVAGVIFYQIKQGRTLRRMGVPLG